MTQTNRDNVPITDNLNKQVRPNTKRGFVVNGLRGAVQKRQSLGEAVNELWIKYNSDRLQFENGIKFKSLEEFERDYVCWACEPVYERSARPSNDGYYVAGYEGQIEDWCASRDWYVGNQGARKAEYRIEDLNLRAIAEAIFHLINGEHNDFMKRYNDRIVNWFIREINQYPDFVSYAAKEAAENKWNMTLECLFNLTWREQPKYDGERETLHFEHGYQVSALRHAISANVSIETIETEIRKLVVCWVTKNENKRLGNKARRIHWLSYYADNGIMMLNEKGEVHGSPEELTRLQEALKRMIEKEKYGVDELKRTLAALERRLATAET